MLLYVSNTLNRPLTYTLLNVTYWYSPLTLESSTVPASNVLVDDAITLEVGAVAFCPIILPSYKVIPMSKSGDPVPGSSFIPILVIVPLSVIS